jgi:hypothetical protein
MSSYDRRSGVSVPLVSRAGAESDTPGLCTGVSGIARYTGKELLEKIKRIEDLGWLQAETP